ncbi:nitric oxide synthase oxygenase [Phragmitibacter flavus]|nr:nitric oxide synthase oxygenase [Phragmitibacter flavus]
MTSSTRTTSADPGATPGHQSPATTASRIGATLTLAPSDLTSTSVVEALAFLTRLGSEQPADFPDWHQRLTVAAAQSQIPTLSTDELAYAAKLAWRNNIRCIGRLHWRALQVRDLRHLTAPDEIFEALIDHLRVATNNGAIQPLISIFTREEKNGNFLRIINHQLIRYACYRNGQALLGDPQNLALTDLAISSGWQPPFTRSAFDILPILIADHHHRIHHFSLPRDPAIVLEVPLSHPDYPWFERLNLRWHAVPAISDMVLDAAGLKYPANVFNGWYVGTEIAARNLGDVHRYNLLPIIAEKMGLPTHSDRNLWKDRAMIELNHAVLHSFDQHGVRLVDHHSASKQFLTFTSKEHAEGREVNGDWTWLVPPISGSTSPLFHRSYAETVEKPGFFYCPWQKP